MDYSQDAQALDLDDKTNGQNALAEEVIERCIRIVANDNRFKQSRLDRIKLYRVVRRWWERRRIGTLAGKGACRKRSTAHGTAL